MKVDFNFQRKRIIIELDEEYSLRTTGVVLALLNENQLYDIDDIIIDCSKMKYIVDADEDIFSFRDKYDKNLYFYPDNNDFAISFFRINSQIATGKPIDVLDDLENGVNKRNE